MAEYQDLRALGILAVMRQFQYFDWRQDRYRMTARAFQNNGTRQDFPQPVMAFAAGRAQRNERNADESKAADAKAYIARMDAFEQTKANKELTAQKEADFKKNGAPLIATAYREAFKSGGQEAASAAGAKTANDYGNKAGIGGMPFVNSMAMFKDGSAVFQGYEYDAANKKLSDVPTNFRLDVNGQAYKAKGKDWVPVDNFLNADDAARIAPTGWPTFPRMPCAMLAIRFCPIPIPTVEGECIPNAPRMAEIAEFAALSAAATSSPTLL